MKKKAIKLVAVLCLAALIFTTGTPTRAESTKYVSTRNFLNYLTMKGVKYSYLGVDDRDETVSVSYALDHFTSLKCNLYFRDDDEVDLRIYNIVTVQTGTNRALSVLNELNADYKFAKFVLDTSDMTVQAEMDMFIDAATCGSVVYEALNMLLLVVDDDEVAPRLLALEYSADV